MKKILLILAIVMLFITPAFCFYIGPRVLDLTSASGDRVLNISVNGKQVIYTKTFDFEGVEFAGIMYQATSASGTPNLKIQLEEGTTGIVTQYAASSDYVVPENFADIETTLTTETAHIKSFSAVVAPFGRIVVTGNAGNPNDTTIKLQLMTITNR